MKDELLIKYIKQECPLEEAKEVLRWIEMSEKNKSYYKQFYITYFAIEIEKSQNAEYSTPINKSQNNVKQTESISLSFAKYKRLLYWSLSAAAVAVMFIFILNKNFNQTSEKPLDYEAYLSDITNTKEIELIINKSKTPIKIKNTEVTISYNSELQSVQIGDSLNIKQGKGDGEINIIHVPYGKNSLLILADGTKVYLNSGSSLVYPSNFTSDCREVYLDGEAYFEVQKEKNLRKFRVRTAYKDIEVTGTQFNVSIDKELKSFETVLVSGKISVNSEKGNLQLVPNQYYGYSADTHKENLKEVDVSNYTAWMDKKMKFNREPLYIVLHKLEKVYNVNITLNATEYSTYLVSGNLDLRNTGEKTVSTLMKILTPNDDTSKMYRINNNLK